MDKAEGETGSRDGGEMWAPTDADGWLGRLTVYAQGRENVAAGVRMHREVLALMSRGEEADLTQMAIDRGLHLCEAYWTGGNGIKRKRGMLEGLAQMVSDGITVRLRCSCRPASEQQNEEWCHCTDVKAYVKKRAGEISLARGQTQEDTREGGRDPGTNMERDEGEGTTWGMETEARSEVTGRDGATWRA